MKIWLTTLLALVSFSAFSAPKSDLWPYWNQSDNVNQQVIDHSAWSALLQRYIVPQGQHHLFQYGKVTPTDKQALKKYLVTLAELDPRTFNQAEQYAYWVNLYNAITVDLILDNYPVSSITKLGGFFSFGPWGKEIIEINGQALSLNDIEHRILRPIWNDPRTHYAVNCASLGCPNLQTVAFTAENTNALLDRAAKAFILSEKGVKVEGDTAQLSSIYDWFAVDFGGEDKLFEHISQYAPQYMGFSGNITYDYDWALNDSQ